MGFCDSGGQSVAMHCHLAHPRGAAKRAQERAAQKAALGRQRVRAAGSSQNWLGAALPPCDSRGHARRAATVDWGKSKGADAWGREERYERLTVGPGAPRVMSNR
jgi:hypothetical protein